MSAVKPRSIQQPDKASVDIFCLRDQPKNPTISFDPGVLGLEVV
jgi:hypothetical protein